MGSTAWERERGRAFVNEGAAAKGAYCPVHTVGAICLGWSAPPSAAPSSQVRDLGVAVLPTCGRRPTAAAALAARPSCTLCVSDFRSKIAICRGSQLRSPRCGAAWSPWRFSERHTRVRLPLPRPGSPQEARYR